MLFLQTNVLIEYWHVDVNVNEHYAISVTDVAWACIENQQTEFLRLIQKVIFMVIEKHPMTSFTNITIFEITY